MCWVASNDSARKASAAFGWDIRLGDLVQFFVKNPGDFGREARAFHQQPFVKGFRYPVQIFQQFPFAKGSQIGPEQIGRVRAGQNSGGIHPADPLIEPHHLGIGFKNFIRERPEGQQQLPQGLPEAGAGLMVGYPVPEQSGYFGPWHPLPGMQAKISQNGARLAAPGHQILAKVANGAQRAEKMDANSRLAGADIQRHKVVLIGILSRQCLTPEISPLGRYDVNVITYGCIGQVLFHAWEAFF